MAIVNNNSIKLEKEMNKPNDWESNIVYIKKNGSVVELKVADDKEGDE